jgi:glutamyl-tRNA reductase
MSLVVLGLSHHAAPISLLESVSLSPEHRTALEEDILASEYVTEAVVVSTCNRTEVYAEALAFHGALTDVSAAVTRQTGVDLSALQPHLYVHYEDRGIAHAFRVASGLDSMAVGESQILGQLRQSLTRAQSHGHVGPELNALLQQALRVGKRVHTETGIDSVSHSLVGAGLATAREIVGPLEEARVLVVGAGGMSALATATAAREGVGSLTVVNRSAEAAHRLADRFGAQAHALVDLPDLLPAAEIVISCTGATGRVVTAAMVQAAGVVRAGRPQVFLDLALPHDVETEVGDLAHATRVGLAELGQQLAQTGTAPQVQQANDLVTGEVAEYLTARTADSVAPTVTALRARALDLVDAELERLHRRTPGLSEHDRAEVDRTVRRVVEKLLHTPTVKVKELAASAPNGSYARALSELFDLDPRDISTVSVPPPDPRDHGGAA